MAKLSSVKSQAAYHAASAAKPNTKSAKANQSSGKAASSASKSRTTSNKVSPQQAKKNYEQAMSRVKSNAVKATNGKTSNSPKPSNVKKDSFKKTNEKTKTEKQAVITQKAYSKAVSTAKTKSKSTTTATTTKYTTKSYESEKIKYLQNEIKNTSSLYKKSELQKEIEFIKIKNKNNNSSITSNTNSSNKISSTSTNGINLANGQTEKITCQSTDFGGEFPGWFGCVSTTIAAMFRINDGAVGTACELVNCNDDGTYPTEGLKGFSFYQFGETLNNNGINQDDALGIIKDQLSNGKTCGVKLERNVNGKITDYGHTVLCSGVISGVSIKDATWNDLLFNDVGRGNSLNRESKQISEINYSQTSYSVPSDGNCCVIIDTTK